MHLNAPVLDLAMSPSGRGYWFVAGDGGVFSFGHAPFHGSTGNLRLAAPMMSMTSATHRQGYWMVASDGGIFSFGTAKFFGSTGSIPLNRPIVGMAPTPSGLGYWLVAADGGIFSFGDARYSGNGLWVTPPYPKNLFTVAPGPTVAIVEAEIEPDVAETVTVPTPELVANPALPWALLITSTSADEELQVTSEVTSCVLPSV